MKTPKEQTKKTHVISVQVDIRELALVHMYFTQEYGEVREISTLAALVRLSMSTICDNIQRVKGIDEMLTFSKALEYLHKNNLKGNLDRPIKRNVTGLLLNEDSEESVVLPDEFKDAHAEALRRLAKEDK